MTRNHRLDVHPTFLLGKNATAAIRAFQRPLVMNWIEAMDDHSLPHATGASSNLALILKLALKVFDQLGQSLSRKRVAGFQRQSTGLGKLSFKFCAWSAIHFHTPAR